MIKIGTSGYSYDDWKGVFYPEKMNKKDFLSFYAEAFRTVEINFTYYRIPSPMTFVQMLRKVPEDFEFVVKTPKEFTHEREKLTGAAPMYSEGIQPLVDAGQLGCLLAQFPQSFHLNDDNLSHLRRVREAIAPDIPINVEFRSREWITDEVFSFLRENNLGFVCVDMPDLPGLIPPVVQATNRIGYVRFHGRLKGSWYQHEEARERYNYEYSPQELEEWMPRIAELEGMAEDVYLFANNHPMGKAIKTAIALAQKLGQPIHPPRPTKEEEREMTLFD